MPAKEEHFGEPLWVHRKGAIAADEAELAVIPGSMAAGCRVVSGRGHALALRSSSHGAGRTLSRSEARRRVGPARLAHEMRDIVYDEALAARLCDEAPSAYKRLERPARHVYPRAYFDGLDGTRQWFEVETSSYHPAREWYLDVDGDGVQDKLFCGSSSDTLHYKLARSVSAQAPVVPTTATEATSDGSIPAFSTMCALECRLSQSSDSPLCPDKQPFSMAFDADGDGTTNLVVQDRLDGWAALVYDDDGFRWRSDWFADANLDPGSHYIMTLDANGDGLRDIVALPDPKHEAPDYAHAKLWRNTGDGFRIREVLRSDTDEGWAPEYPAFAMDIDGDGKEEIVQPPNGSGAPAPWLARRIGELFIESEELGDLVAGPGVLGDFDGDGNIDVLSGHSDYSFRLHRGKGRRRNLLSTVTDGLGRYVEVEYDRVNPLGATTYREEGSCEWPVKCLDEVGHPVVSSHFEGHYLLQSRQTLLVDARHSYTYRTARADRAGYGWLGFDRRTIAVHDREDDLVRKVTIDYLRPENPGPIPYAHTLAGLTRQIIEDFPHADSALIGDPSSPVEANRHASNVVTNEWEVGTSILGGPFPKLVGQTRETREGYYTSETNPALFHEVSTYAVDSFGNLTSETTTRYDGPVDAPTPGSASSTHVTTFFEPTPAQVDAWLIALPEWTEVEDRPRCDPGEPAVACTARRKLRRSDFGYDDLGQLETVTRQPDDAKLYQKTTLERDARGNVTFVTTEDASGTTRRLEIDYDSRRLFPSAFIAHGEGTTHVTQVRYDDRFGTTTAAVDPNQIDSTFSYDELGVERHRRGPSGEVETDYGPKDFYFVDSNVDAKPIHAAYEIVSTVAGGGQSRQELNALGQVVRTATSGFQGQEVSQELVYDHRQRLRTHYRPHVNGDLSQGSIEYEYDELDRVVRESHPNGAEIEVAHASAAHLRSEYQDWLVPGGASITRVTIPPANDEGLDRELVTVRDREGRTLRVIDALGESTHYAYAAFGTLRSITDAGGRSITMSHDAFGRRLSVTDQARGGAEIAEYNGLDELVATEDAAGRASSLFYDDFGRLERVEDDDGTSQWLYDGAGPNEIGRLVETISPTGQRTVHGYEAPENGSNRGLQNRVTQFLTPPTSTSTTPIELVTQLEFDDFSRLERIQYPDTVGVRLSVAYDYDVAGHVQRAYIPNDPLAPTLWELIEADQGYRIGLERFGDSSWCSDGTGTKTRRQYDPDTGAPTSIETTCGTNVVQHLTYGYDTSGNLNRRQNHVSGSVEEYVYDALDRPVALRNGSAPPQTIHTFDPQTGRLTSALGVGTYEYKSTGRDWLQTAGDITYDHDLVGNVTTRTGPTVPGGSQQIDYTTFDLPSTITTGDGPSATVTSFAYDSSGSRVVRQSPSSTTYYAGSLYQRSDLADQSKTHRFMVYAGGRPIAQIDRNESAQTGWTEKHQNLHDDVLGSIQTITERDGDVIATRDYDLFGKQRSAGGLEADIPYGFTGHESDAELGLINMKGRIFDPHAGQFLSADPVLSSLTTQGMNRYAYVYNSPLNYTDPSGFIPGFEGDDFFNEPAGLAASGLFTAGVVGLMAYGSSGAGATAGSAATAGSVGSVAVTGTATSNVATSSAGFWQTLGQAYNNGLGNFSSIAGGAIRMGTLPQYAKMVEVRPVGSTSARAVANRGAAQASGGSQALATSLVQEGGSYVRFAQNAGTPNEGTEGTGNVTDARSSVRPQPEEDIESQIWRTRMRAYEYARQARAREITSKEGLARVAEYAATLTNNPERFIDIMGGALGNSRMRAPASPAAERGIAPRFTDSGFRPDYRDGSNQVRHFAGGLVAGAAYGGRTGAAANTLREWSQGSFGSADVRLGNAAAYLGDRIVQGAVPLSSVGSVIRVQF